MGWACTLVTVVRGGRVTSLVLGLCLYQSRNPGIPDCFATAVYGPTGFFGSSVLR